MQGSGASAANGIDGSAPDDLDRLGYAVLPGVLDASQVAGLVAEMEALQAALVDGSLDRSHHGGDVYTAAASGNRASHPHYVLDVARCSAAADAVFHHPRVTDVVNGYLVGRAGVPEVWEFGPEHGRDFGVVYQDARPGDATAYTRIGWHTDRQAYPTSDFFPAVAVTVHLDATSPANGFLRVVPGSHRWGIDGMPPAFERVPGEVAVYCEEGDVLLHHCDLWHAAARATEDPPGGVRRHLRGSYFGGRRPGPTDVIEPFNKNAAR